MFCSNLYTTGQRDNSGKIFGIFFSNLYNMSVYFMTPFLKNPFTCVV